MADLSDMLQKLAFYQNGGQDPGTTNADQFNQGYGMVHSVINDVLAIKKAKVDEAKTKSDMAKTGQETAALQNQNAEFSPAKPAIPSQILNAPPPGAEGPSGPTLPGSPAVPAQSYKQADTASGVNLRNAQAEYYRSGQKGAKEDLMPAVSSGFATLDYMRQLYPGVPDDKLNRISIGELKNNQGVQKQSSLENERNRRYGERIDQRTLDYAKDHILRDPIMLKFREQTANLGIVNSLSNLVAQGNTVAASALGLKEAKGLGEVGVMTNQDVVRYVQSGQLTQRAADIFERWRSGTPTSATQAEIAEINNAIQHSLAEQEQKIIVPAVDRFARNMGLTSKEAAYQLNVNYRPEMIPSAAGVNDPAAAEIQKQLPQGAQILSIERVPD